jgi:hypothetical protein
MNRQMMLGTGSGSEIDGAATSIQKSHWDFGSCLVCDRGMKILGYPHFPSKRQHDQARLMHSAFEMIHPLSSTDLRYNTRHSDGVLHTDPETLTWPVLLLSERSVVVVVVGLLNVTEKKIQAKKPFRNQP